MSPVKRVGSWTLVLALALALGACEEAGQGPTDETQLDPAAITSALDVVNSVFETSQFKSLESLDRLAWVSEGRVLMQGGDLVRNALMASAAGGLGSDAASDAQEVLALSRALTRATDDAGAFDPPSEVVGTFEWDGSQQAYVRTEVRTGVQPSAASTCGDVSRIVLYALDPSTGQPLEPLFEIGYLDVVYLCSGGIGMTLAGANGVTYVDFVLAPASSGLTLDGFVSDGYVVLTIDVDYVENESHECAQYGDCAGSTYRFDALLGLNAPPLEMGLFYYFAFTETGFELSRGFSFDHLGQPVELITTEYYLETAPYTYWVTFYSQVWVGGNLFGVIDATGNELLYLLPNGQPMAPEETAALEALLEAPGELLSAIGELLGQIVAMLGPAAGEIIPPILLP
jgi:hypothetical protein